MSYDTKCLQLARDFLSDEPSINDERHARMLAQEIQDAIEGFMNYALLEPAVLAASAPPATGHSEPKA